MRHYSGAGVAHRLVEGCLQEGKPPLVRQVELGATQLGCQLSPQPRLHKRLQHSAGRPEYLEGGAGAEVGQGADRGVRNRAVPAQYVLQRIVGGDIITAEQTSKA